MSSTEGAQGRWHLTPAGTFCKCTDDEHLYYEDALGIDDLNALEAELVALRAEKEQAEKKAALVPELASLLSKALYGAVLPSEWNYAKTLADDAIESGGTP